MPFIDINDQEWRYEFSHKNGPMLLVLYKPHSLNHGASLRLMERIERERFHITLVCMDVSECPITARRLRVHKTPTFIFFVGGFQLFRVDGLNREKIRSLFDTIWRNRGTIKSGFSSFAKILFKRRR